MILSYYLKVQSLPNNRTQVLLRCQQITNLHCCVHTSYRTLARCSHVNILKEATQ